jgi:hypothetical protein
MSPADQRHFGVTRNLVSPPSLPQGGKAWELAMSWSELERLVQAAETGPPSHAVLHRCRSKAELVLAARKLGYRITRMDLLRAWEVHRSEAIEAELAPEVSAAKGLG